MAGESARHLARSHADTHRAQAYAHGADGEEFTARTLAFLDPSWIVWHDLHWPGRSRANIDHLVIGPGGVFVIDSKHWSGFITVVGGCVRQNGQGREIDVAAVGDAALAVSRLVPERADQVLPVMCFVRQEEIRGRSRDVLLCSSSTLRELLESRPDVLSPEDVAAVSDQLRHRMRSYQAPLTSTEHDVTWTDVVFVVLVLLVMVLMW